MGLKQQGSNQQATEQSGVVENIKQIFGPNYNQQFLKDNKLLKNNGQLDTIEFQRFLVKRGYSEEFARDASERLTKGEITAKDMRFFQVAAKDDLERKGRESGVTGEIKASFVSAAIKGNVSANAWALRLDTASPEWRELDEERRRLHKNSSEGRITKKEYQEGVQTAPAEQQIVLARLELRHECHERDFNVTGGANAVAINQAKDEQELRNLVVNQLRLFTVFEWNKIAADIGSTYQSLYKPSTTSTGMQLAISQMMQRNMNEVAQYLNSVSHNAVAEYSEAIILDRASQYYDKSSEAQRQYKDKEEFLKKVTGLMGGEDGVFMQVRKESAAIETKASEGELTAKELGQYTEKLRSATVKILEIEFTS